MYLPPCPQQPYRRVSVVWHSHQHLVFPFSHSSVCVVVSCDLEPSFLKIHISFSSGNLHYFPINILTSHSSLQLFSKIPFSPKLGPLDRQTLIVSLKSFFICLALVSVPFIWLSLQPARLFFHLLLLPFSSSTLKIAFLVSPGFFFLATDSCFLKAVCP